MAYKTFNMQVTMEEEKIDDVFAILRRTERYSEGACSFRMTSIEDRLLEELQNCINYEEYKVCIFTSNKDEKLDIEEKVRNLLDSINFSLNQCTEHEKENRYWFGNRSRFIVRNAQDCINNYSKGMRFNTIVYYNVDYDTYNILYKRYYTYSHPAVKCKDYMVYIG